MKEKIEKEPASTEVTLQDAGKQTSQAYYLQEKAAIDSAVATAMAFPRSMEEFNKRALEMVTIDVDTAASCIYRRPVGKDEKGVMQFAEGNSIRMAEIVAACYGNVLIGATIIERTPRYVVARGFARDLQANYSATSETIESTVKKNGEPYSERQAVVVAKVALSKARRDVTFQVIPKALCKVLERAAKDTAIGKGKTMEQRRDAIMEWIKILGIEESRVWKALGIKGKKDIGIDEMFTLTGIKTAINDKDTTVDEAFPPLDFDPSSAASDIKTKSDQGAASNAADAGGKKDIPKEILIEIEHAIAVAEKLEDVDRIESGYPELKNNKHFISIISKAKIAIAKKI